MGEEQVKVIRQSTRNLLNLHRRIHRDIESDFRRCLDDNSVSAEDITEIANKLKTKTAISQKELQTLKNGLLDDPMYIELVLNIHGALRGLVRELSGRDVKKQCEAAGCCCNLSLGDAKAGHTVAKAAGPYLIAALDSFTHELIVPCAWALGNISGSSLKSCNLLVAQGAMFKLTDALNTSSDDVRDSVVYALLHVSYQLRDDLGIEYVKKIIDNLSKVELTLQSSQLLFTLSCHKDFNNSFVSMEFIEKMLNLVQVSIDKHLFACPHRRCCQLLYLLRTLSNLYLNDSLYSLFINFLTENNLGTMFKMLLGKEGDVKESLLWFLGNLYNHKSENDFVGSLF